MQSLFKSHSTDYYGFLGVKLTHAVLKHDLGCFKKGHEFNLVYIDYVRSTIDCYDKSYNKVFHGVIGYTVDERT
jgi:hypothetical protein